MKSIKTYTLEEAKRALEHYCVYQDRCHKEVEEKLSKMRLIPEVIEIVISHLIAENFLNETRFAQSYARGKFRIKKWGKLRITRELKARHITEYNIKKALKEIEPSEYIATLESLIEKKIASINETDFYKKRKKIIDFLTRQGFEATLIFDMIATYLPKT